MANWRSIFSLLCILFAFSAWAGDGGLAGGDDGEEGPISCEAYLATLNTRQILDPAGLHLRLKEYSQIKSPTEDDLSQRKSLVADYEKVIYQISHEVRNLKALYSEQFGLWRFTPGIFSGERLLIDQAIEEMERNLRDLKRELKEARRLLPRQNLFYRATDSINEWLLHRRKVSSPVQAPAPVVQEDWFLSPLNPAGPNFGKPVSRDDDP